MHFTGVVRYLYGEFRKRALAEDRDLAEDFVNAIYGGKVVVLDDAFSRDEVIEIKDICYGFSQHVPDSPSQRITQDCPDNHQIFDSTMRPMNGYEGLFRASFCATSL